jgi:hypothetical protein
MINDIAVAFFGGVGFGSAIATVVVWWFGIKPLLAKLSVYEQYRITTKNT